MKELLIGITVFFSLMLIGRLILYWLRKKYKRDHEEWCEEMRSTMTPDETKIFNKIHSLNGDELLAYVEEQGERQKAEWARLRGELDEVERKVRKLYPERFEG